MNQGNTIGHYKIIRPLGKGGMGEVYLAEDTRLKREVAVKVLPEAVRKDPERLKRFRREAEAAAKLNHPNIATIHALEDFDGEIFITMEHIEGKLLSDHIPANGMDLDSFFSTFIPLADALAHAHNQGRAHRDLKPANIMITEDGTPKILDFGLARIIDPDSAQAAYESDTAQEIDSQSPTQTIKAEEQAAPNLTRGGQLMGTPMYMSPEQAEREETDARTDIFSLGVVMYEALTGVRPFEGKTLESIIGRIVEAEPKAVTEIKPVTPYTLDWLIRMCLKKDRGNRIQTSQQLHSALHDVQQEVQTGTILVDASQSVIPVWRQPWASTVFGVLLAIIVAFAVWTLKPSSEVPLRKYQLPDELSIRPDLAISPDGSMVAYTNDERLWIRDLRQLTTREIPSSEGALWSPFWSPDGNYIGYFTEDALKKVPFEGGESTTLCPLQLPGGGYNPKASWHPDGTIVFVFTRLPNVYEVSDRGGEPRVVMQADSLRGEVGFSSPYILPEGRGLLLAVWHEGDTWDIIIQDNENRSVILSDQRSDNVARFSTFTYSPTGHIIYDIGGDIRAQPFSLSRLSATGNPILVAQNGWNPSVGPDGTLLYLQVAPGQGQGQLVQISRNGQIEKIIGQPQPQIGNLVISPDGKLVVASGSANRQNSDIWIYDIERGVRTRFTTAPGSDVEPVWSPSGDQIMWRRLSGIYMQDSDGRGAPQRLTGVGAENPEISPDGRYMIYHRRNDQNNRDIWLMNLEDGQPIPFLQTPFHEGLPVPSPDGRYLAYTSDESGVFEIYLRTFPDGGNKTQVSVNGGVYARWNGTGDELFYVEDNRLMAVSIKTAPSLQVGKPQQIFNGDEVNTSLGSRGGFLIPTYDVSADGQRFVVSQNIGADLSPTITVVQNWIKEFEGQE